MGLRLINKMEEFFNAISVAEKSRNGELNSKIKCMKKYLGLIGESEDGNEQGELIQKYFHIQFRNEFKIVR